MSDQRKADHIELAFQSHPDKGALNFNQVYYEPLLSAHPNSSDYKKQFLNYPFKMPLWISSMTGGTQKAKVINENLARACGEFQIGMGLGSCRPLLENSSRFSDFNVRHLMQDAPLYTNFGIAQIEELIAQDRLHMIDEITNKLKANGIIIHVNPLQEWAQPEGDRFKVAPLESIKIVCDKSKYPIIVKEVGQGIGPKSLSALSQLPIAAIELAGYGGTNFTLLEQTRHNTSSSSTVTHNNFGYVGHSAQEMINWLNLANSEKEIIISGGIIDPIQGHILMCQYQGNSIVGMASEVLKHAMGDYEQLKNYLTNIKEQFVLANAFIKGE